MPTLVELDDVLLADEPAAPRVALELPAVEDGEGEVDADEALAPLLGAALERM